MNLTQNPIEDLTTAPNTVPANNLSRRDFIQFISAAIATATLSACSSEERKAKPKLTPAPAPLAKITDKEISNETIVSIERGFKAFEAEIRPLLKNLPPDLTNLINRQFELMDLNLDNPYKEAHTFHHEYQKAGGKSPTNKTHYFRYKYSSDKPKVEFIASFTRGSRTINIHRGFNPNNKLHQLYLFHELVHASQDLIARHNQDTPSYLNSLEIGINAFEEGFAYGQEIELLNALLGNALEHRFNTGGSFNDSEIQAFMKWLEIPTGDFLLFKSLIIIAQNYYPERNPNGKNLINFIIQEYKALGKKIYIIDKNGGIHYF